MKNLCVTALLALVLAAPPLPAQSKKAKAAPPAAPAPQKVDEEYTKLIHEYLQDPRITTELVDHMPASDTVPSPLKFLGRIPGKPGELTYAKDIHRYYQALANASPRIAHAILTPNAQCGYTVSVRAPRVKARCADGLCRQFATGGGRAAAAGINHLPEEELPEFVRRFDQAFS